MNVCALKQCFLCANLLFRYPPGAPSEHEFEIDEQIFQGSRPCLVIVELELDRLTTDDIVFDPMGREREQSRKEAEIQQ